MASAGGRAEQEEAVTAALSSSSAEELHAEVLRLQHKLGELHSGDLNTLRRAYNSLCQHVQALEAEARGIVEELREFEINPVPPEVVANELGVAAAVTFGVAILNQTIRVLPVPIKAGAPIIVKGLWLLGGVFVVARLTGGTLAHVASMFNRNASRKRRLLKRLEAVQDRITIMVSLQQWAETQAGPQAGAGTVAAAAGAEGGSASSQAGAEAGSGRRVSPAGSSGSSVELVEMPQVEELEAAEEGLAAAGVRTRAVPPRPEAAPPGGSSAQVPQARGSEQQVAPRPGSAQASSLESLRAYVQLGSKK